MVLTRSMYRRVEAESQRFSSGLEDIEMSTDRENIPVVGLEDIVMDETQEEEELSTQFRVLQADLHEDVSLDDPEDDGKKKKGKSQDDEISAIPQNFHVEMLSATMKRLRMVRNTPPPAIPLCRVYIHESVRQVGPLKKVLKTTFRMDGYLEEKGAFVLSLQGVGGVSVKVNDEIKATWDSIWTEVNDSFERELANNEDWADLSGKMFLCWDENHRTKAWIEEIAESFRFDREKHISVKATFIHVSPSDSMPLLTALNRINK